MKVYNSAGYAEKRLKFATLSYDGSEYTQQQETNEESLTFSTDERC